MVVYIPLPRHAHRTSIISFLSIVSLVIVWLMVWAVFDPSMRERVACMALLIPVLLPVGFALSNMGRSDHFDIEYANQLTKIIATLDARLWTPYWRRRWWTWNEFVGHCRESSIRPPGTIVDKRVKERLERIDLTPSFLEPESILSSGTSGRKAAVLMVVLYCLCMLFHLSVGDYFFAGLFAAFGVVLAATYPPVRDLFRTMRFDEGNLIAGMGSLSFKGDKRWTINDAVMLVQTANGKPPYYVSFVGEAGYKLLTFTDEKDPDFVKLWQRWNHPKPRPELVVE